jgi:hypothetical protein
MSELYQSQRIRLAFDVTSHGAAVDQITGETPKIWRGTHVTFELAGLWGAPTSDSSDVIDVTNIASLSIDVKPYADRDGSAVLSAKTTTTINTITKDEWEAGTVYHAAITYLHTETAPTLTADSVDYWLVVTVITNDSTPRYITWGATKLTIEEDGSGGWTTPAPSDPTYPTVAQVNSAIYDAAYDWIILGNPDTGKYRKVQIKGTGDAMHLAIGDTDIT